MIIDVHSHLFPPDLMAAIAKAGGRLPQLEAAPLQSMALGERHELMLENQVDLGLLSVGVLQPYHEDVRTAVDLAKAANDAYLQASAESGGWLATWAALPLPHVDAALAELARVAGDPGCIGVTLGTSVLDLDLDDKALEPVYAELNARGTTVFVHPSMSFDGFGANDLGMQRSIGGMIEDTVAGIRLLLSGVVVRYPKINFIVPHLGGTLPFIYGRVRGTSRRPSRSGPTRASCPRTTRSPGCPGCGGTPRPGTCPPSPAPWRRSALTASSSAPTTRTPRPARSTPAGWRTSGTCPSARTGRPGSSATASRRCLAWPSNRPEGT